ncbi:FecR domain-containing protein [Neisseria sp. Ec49-e6-T10]|uniref:FecR domain-containing protein n=1 Tax=Neisseria sp. Ec49-e6-T10 TaxID=3140744 RepID=UPI003EBCD4E2
MKNLCRKVLVFLGIALFSGAIGAADTAYWEYRVREGDNLWSFSERHLISPAYALRLRTLNKIADPYNIRPNTILKVPFQWGKKIAASASIASFSGKVTVKVNGQSQNVSVGLTLPAGTHITTDKKSQATLRFADGSHLILSNDTSIVLGQQTYYPTTGASHNKIELEKGSVKGDIEHPPLMNNRYEIQTRTAVTAVKGTELDVSVDDEGKTRTSVYSGVVDVSSGKDKIELEKGYGSLVKGHSNLTKEELLVAPDFEKAPEEFVRNLPQFSWKNIKDAKSYQVELYKYDGRRIELLSSYQTEYNKVIFPIMVNGQYVANVSGIPESGLLGIPTKVPFQVKVNPLPPLIVSPGVNDTIFSKTVDLHLGKSKEYSAYVVEYTKDVNFKENILQHKIDVNDKEIAFSVPESGVWYWRVAGVDKKKQTGVFSGVNKLQVGTLKRKSEITLRAFSIDNKDVTYELVLTKEDKNGQSVNVYNNVNKEPVWQLKDVQAGQQYEAQVNYLLHGEVLLKMPVQLVSW